MKCKQCEYPLWNIRARNCPECGTPFKPSDFEFVLNSTRFCCPHCDQAYYGTGAKGHLTPKSFNCANCGQAIDMDETVVRPAEGVAERDTQVDVAPWLDEERTWPGRLFATAGWAMTAPQRLAAGLASHANAPSGVMFMLVNAALTSAGASSVLAIGFVFGAVAAAQGGGGAGVGLGLLGGCLGIMLGFMVFTAVLAIIWAACTHVLLLITGGLNTTGFKETMQAIAFGSGANLISGIPCFGGYIGPFWWLISSTLLAKELHRIRGGRAAFVTLTPPVALALLFIGLYAAAITFAVTAAGGVSGVQSRVTAVQETSSLQQALARHQATTGAYPTHALELIPSQGVTPWAFTSGTTSTLLMDVEAAGVPLDEWDDLRVSQQSRLIADAAANLPDDVIAYRVGDFVFCYPGLPTDRAAVTTMGLWEVIFAPLPENRRNANMCAAGGGVLTPIAPEQRATTLASQNGLRSNVGLPPLPSPETIRFAVRADGTLVDDPGAVPNDAAEADSEGDSETDSGVPDGGDGG